MGQNKTTGLVIAGVLLVGAIILLLSQSQTLSDTQTNLEGAQNDLTAQAEALSEQATSGAESLDAVATQAAEDQASAVADAEDAAATVLAESLDEAATQAAEDQADAVADAEDVAATTMAEALAQADADQADAVADAEDVAATVLADSLAEAAAQAAEDQADAVADAEGVAAVAMAEALAQAANLANIEQAVAVDMVQNLASQTSIESDLASMMPESIEIYFTTRIGADLIAEFDAMSVAMYEKLPESLAIEPDTIENTLRSLFAEEGYDWDKFISVVGQFAAVGIESVGDFNSGEEPLVVFIAEITNQREAEQVFLELAGDASEMLERKRSRNTVLYINEAESITVIISPTHFIVTNILDYEPIVDAPLSDSEAYTSAIGMLPADNYNALVYISETIVETMLNEGDAQDLQSMGLNPEDAGAIVGGSTKLGGSTFAFDLAIQTIAPMPTSTVSIDFLKGMPSSTDAFIVATDLTNVYNSITDVMQTIARANDEEDPSAQIPLMFSFTGLDLEEDILSWTTGGYGVFIGADFVTLFDEAMTTGTVSELNFDAGIVIEATDVALAQNAAAELGNFMSMAFASESGLTITQEETDGVPLTSIIVEVPIDPSMPPFELEFVLTATDNFFFLGTRSALDKIMSGNTLAKNIDFAKSTQFFLDNATSVWYSNSDGVVVSTVIPLALLGPAIGNVFDNIVEELNADSSSTISSNSSSSGLGIMDSPEMIMELLNAYDEIFSSMTLTTSIDDDGVVLIRGTMSLNP